MAALSATLNGAAVRTLPPGGDHRGLWPAISAAPCLCRGQSRARRNWALDQVAALQVVSTLITAFVRCSRTPLTQFVYGAVRLLAFPKLATLAVC